jgi:hypothetical protein
MFPRCLPGKTAGSGIPAGAMVDFWPKRPKLDISAIYFLEAP